MNELQEESLASDGSDQELKSNIQSKKGEQKKVTFA